MPRPATPVTNPSDDLAHRAVLANASWRSEPRQAERAFLQATQDLTTCFVAAWERARQDGTTAQMLLVELQQTRFLLREARERARILAARFYKTGPRHRPHYTPPLRFRILERMRQHMLSVEETARCFLVTPQTIYNWLGEMRRQPQADTVGSSVVPVPPLRRFAQGTRRLVRQMKHAGFGGKKKIAQMLLRHSWKISPRTVGRILKEKPPPRGPRESSTQSRPTTVRGDYPNHLWLQDVTEIPTLFPFLPLHLMLVLDACSRLPLAATLRLARPSAADAIALLDRAIRTHRKPRHLVVDQGSQFTAESFRDFVRGQKIRIRHGAVGQTHSLGLIDRFFRTLKDSLGSLRPWSIQVARSNLNLALIHYAHVRPHTSLAGLTPIERYYGIRGHLPRAVPLPRGQPGDPEPEVPFDFVFLDPVNQSFPILVPRAA